MASLQQALIAAALISALGSILQTADAQQAPHAWFVFDHTSGKCEQAPADFTPDSAKAELKRQGAPVTEKTLNDKNGRLAMLAVVNKANESGMAFFTTMAICNFIAQKDPALVGN
jgi:hypothetical protein